MASVFEDLQKPEKWLTIKKMECDKKQATMLKERENTYKINN